MLLFRDCRERAKTIRQLQQRLQHIERFLTESNDSQLRLERAYSDLAQLQSEHSVRLEEHDALRQFLDHLENRIVEAVDGQCRLEHSHFELAKLQRDSETLMEEHAARLRQDHDARIEENASKLQPPIDYTVNPFGQHMSIPDKHAALRERMNYLEKRFWSLRF